MNKIFEANEDLKETLVKRFGIIQAKTVYHEQGIYLGDPFYETEASWPDYSTFKNLTWEDTSDIADLMHSTKVQIEKLGGQMTQPIFEVYDNKPRMAWAVFLNTI